MKARFLSIELFRGSVRAIVPRTDLQTLTSPPLPQRLRFSNLIRRTATERRHGLQALAVIITYYSLKLSRYATNSCLRSARCICSTGATPPQISLPCFFEKASYEANYDAVTRAGNAGKALREIHNSFTRNRLLVLRAFYQLIRTIV